MGELILELFAVGFASSSKMRLRRRRAPAFRATTCALVHGEEPCLQGHGPETGDHIADSHVHLTRYLHL